MPVKMLLDMDLATPTSGGACPTASAFLARTSGLDAAHIAAYNGLICGLVADGVWTKLDVLRVYATQDSTTALLNLVSSSYNGTSHGSPTFTIDRGFTGSGGSTVYIDSGFNPSTAGGLYTQSDAHMSGWFINTSAQGPPNGYSNGAGIDTYTWPRFSGDNNSYCRINATNAGNPGTPPGFDGHFIGDRSGTDNSYFRNGSIFFGPSLIIAQVLLNLNFYELGFNNNGTASGSASQQAMFSIGAHLTGADKTNLYNRLRTYMTAVGVP